MTSMTSFRRSFPQWIFPTATTLAYLALLIHKSEAPAILGRYSLSYAFLLSLAGFNVGLLWHRIVRRTAHREPIARSTVWLVALFLVFSTFVFDFAIGLQARDHWVWLILLAGIFWQVTTLKERPSPILGHLVVVIASSVIGITLIEAAFVALLVETRTPRNHREFLRFVSSQWPQPVSLAKPPGTFRILGLGDSFGVAGGAAYNYHYVLQDILQRHCLGPIEVVNTSAIRYTPTHELAILPFGLAFSPDLVLHGFFVGNDFTVSGEDLHEFLRLSLVDRPGVSRYRPYGFFFRRWIEAAVHVIRDRRRQQAEAENGIIAGSFSKSSFFDAQLRRLNDWGKLDRHSVERMNQVLPILEAIRFAVEKTGANYVMVIHPDQTQVDEIFRRDLFKTFRLDEEAYDFERPQRVLTSYCIERGIRCVDLLPAFRAAAAHEPLYLLRDGHYNARGNRLAAERISQFLRISDLLPPVAQCPGSADVPSKTKG